MVKTVTFSIDLKHSQAEIWHQTSSGHRNKINRCKRRGLTAKVVNFPDYLADFVANYEETMDRVKANSTSDIEVITAFDKSLVCKLLILCTFVVANLLCRFDNFRKIYQRNLLTIT